MSVNDDANRRFTEWAKGKHPILALVAAQLATNASVATDMLRILAHGTKDLERLRPLPPAARWLSFYRDHDAVARGLVEAFYPSTDPEISAYDFVYVLAYFGRAVGRFTDEDRAQFKIYLTTEEGMELAKNLADMINTFLRVGWYEVLTPDAKPTAECEASLEKAKDAGLLQFLLCVWIPSLVLANDYPSRLMRRARAGDMDALEHLLRLDKTVLQEPRIAEQLQDAWMTPRRARFRRLAAAIAGKPKQLNSKAVKMRLAALASRFFQLEVAINSTELRDLFDIAMTMETGGRQKVDTDLPESPEAIGKGVQRMRKLWSRIIPSHPDTKRK